MSLGTSILKIELSPSEYLVNREAFLYLLPHTLWALIAKLFMFTFVANRQSNCLTLLNALATIG